MLAKIVSYLAPNRSITNRFATASANTNVTLTMTGILGIRHVAHNIQWSYSGTPAGGNITITDGGSTICNVDIIAGGPGALSAFFSGSIGNTLIITLNAGGGIIVGKLSCQTTEEVI